MNKKLFLGMFAAAGMLFATSCSNDELDVVQSGNEAQVTFLLATEGGIATRAISDGTGAKKLVYAVYNANGELIETIANADVNGQIVDNSAFDNSLTENVTITLAKGQQYTVAFWAQNPNCTAYTTTDLKNVTVDYVGLNNDETRDAFFAAETFTVSRNAEIDVTLKRPFAQINVGVTEDDWNAAYASGVNINESNVVIQNAANAINLLDGTVSGEEKVTYSWGKAPVQNGETLMVDTDNDGNKETYKWLSMSYILANDETTGAAKTTLENLAFTFRPVTGEDIAFSEGLNNVPVQRNWRTNILGKILTGDIQFNITIDPVYVDDFNWSVPQTVSTSAELVAALQTAVAAGETNIVFDANGANIGNFNKDDNTWFTTNLVPTGVTVTLRNATVSGISRWNNANGTLIFENCTFTNNSAYSINFAWGNGHVKFTNCELYGWCSFDGVTVEMNDCNIAGNGRYALVRSKKTFTMNNCTIDGSNAIKDDDYPDGVSIVNGAVLTMTGCTMTDAEYEYGQSLIDGNEVVDYGENSSYIIVDGKRLVCNPASLEYALKNGNAILMENNITVEAHLTKTSHGTNINIDGGGNELTLRGIYGVSGANVSLSNMTLVDSKTDDYTIFNQGGKIELNNVTYNSTINMAFQMAGGGDVVLTDCNISGDVTGDYAASNIWCGDGRNVTVNGGTYGSIFMNAQYHSGWPAASAHAASKITLNDGTITKLILETELGAEGYYVSATLTQNGGTITNLVENPQNLDLTGRSQYNK